MTNSNYKDVKISWKIKDETSFRSVAASSKSNKNNFFKFELPVDIRVDKPKPSIISPEDLFPTSVENSNGKITKFDANRIRDNLIDESKLDLKTANDVTTEVLRRIVQLENVYITGPLIREIACNVMVSMNLPEARNKYTRLGLSIKEFENILNSQKSAHYCIFKTFVDMALQHFHLTDQIELVKKLHVMAMDMKIENDELLELVNYINNSIKLKGDKND